MVMCVWVQKLLFFGVNNILMSENETVPAVEQELPIKKYVNALKEVFKRVKNFDFRKMFRGIFTFLSIIIAYFVVQFTHQHALFFQKLTHLKLKHPHTIPLLFFVLSLYLIFWNIVARFLKNRALRPPPKSDEYQQIPQTDELLPPPTLAPLPNGEMYAHEIIEDALNKTIYFFLLLIAVASYAYFNQIKNATLPPLVSLERLNLLGVWFLLGAQIDLLGRLLQKLTGITEFRVLGISMGFIVGVLVLGLANGLNTFIFI